MSDNHYNKYGNEFPPPHSHYQVKANVTSNNGHQQFNYDVNAGSQAGFESNTHLSSLSNCVKRLQTQLNQYLTKIIDEGSDGPTNYNLGSGEVLNSHLMEQYSSTGPPPPTNSYGQMGGMAGVSDPSSINNGYSYYSNYPSTYPVYPPPQAPYHPTAAATADYYNQQYSNFQEPKGKKHRSK
ncbi:hypothetical protein QR98_0020500 [Sarcoptes scabiei]|uniref:Uncharacterized protein n=1 Tax=Sarcoptes scabiei TaxID=52283 RepID=A0A131ZY76_SARSC|nr:hypothetical protein QR98_0020500 [Sarcoptes scabiei]